MQRIVAKCIKVVYEKIKCIECRFSCVKNGISSGSQRYRCRSCGKEYEMDELCIYVKNKARKRWIAYAIRKDTREVVDFSIGSRTNRTLTKVTDTLILSNAVKVFTDKLINYKYLLPSSIHSTKNRGTNHIERKNLTLRTHLKRLGRKTICFSRSIAMLAACLKIYFWA
ncbi:IS1 family transposase [Edaphocola flava]|uniref:IS1 family transposase n=1 Tax=Edaphocola flava TaxID=2499629 RepID=UPI00100A9107|nr:IS1 family transposase [Edaphocola flava]